MSYGVRLPFKGNWGTPQPKVNDHSAFYSLTARPAKDWQPNRHDIKYQISKQQQIRKKIQQKQAKINFYIQQLKRRQIRHQRNVEAVRKQKQAQIHKIKASIAYKKVQNNSIADVQPIIKGSMSYSTIKDHSQIINEQQFLRYLQKQ